MARMKELKAGAVLAVLVCTAAIGACKPAEKQQPVAPRATTGERPRPPSAGPLHKEGQAMALNLTSAVFGEGKTIPAEHTGDGRDISPPLKWSGLPEGTQELALIVDDPDAPGGTWTHWLVWGLRPDIGGLPEGVEKTETVTALDGAEQGRNDFRKVGYGGPAPPPGRPHRYVFTLFALDTKLRLEPGSKKQELLRAMEGHILAKATLTGMYGR